MSEREAGARAEQPTHAHMNVCANAAAVAAADVLASLAASHTHTFTHSEASRG